RDPARDVDPDRGDLRVADPDRGDALAAVRAHALDAQLGERADQDLLEVVDVALDVAAARLEPQGRIADQLARAGGRDLPASGGLAERDRERLEPLRGPEDVVPGRVAPQRVDRIVLEEEQGLVSA